MKSIFVGKHGVRALWRALAFIAFALAIGFLMQLALRSTLRTMMAEVNQWSNGVPGPRFSIVAELVLVVATVGATWVMATIERRPVTSYGLADSRGVSRFLAGLACGFVALTAVVGILVATGHLAFDSIALHGFAAWRFAVEWFVAFLMVGVAEEMLLRGYLQQTLARGMGFWPAAILLSIVFGGLHKGNSGEETIGLITAGLAGLVFCYGLWRTGSLWWPIGFHAAWDWGQSYFYGTPDSGSLVSRHLLVSHPLGATWESGGAVGPEGSIYVLLVLVAAVPLMHFFLGSRPDGNASWLARDGERRDELAGGEVDRVDRAGVGAD